MDSNQNLPIEFCNKIDAMNENFKELVQSLALMKAEVTEKINKVEMKQLTTINNLKIIKETLRDMQK